MDSDHGGINLEAVQARALFPRGLAQADAFRFSLDSLLLAAFVRLPKRSRPRRGIDLGAGCGVVGLALLLDQARTSPDRTLTITGVEIDSEQSGFARKNSRVLGFEKQYEVINCDVSSYEIKTKLDFALANPPYRVPGMCRTSPDAARSRSRFETDAGLDGFVAVAARSLKTRAPFFLVHLAERLDAVLASLAAHGFAPKRLRFVHGRADKEARLVLVEARLHGGAGITVEPPLTLYGPDGAETAITPEALAFCPFLECNAARGGADHA